MKQIKQLIWKVRVRLWYCCNHYSIISKTMSQFFEVLIFNQEIWGNVHYVCEINLIFKETLIKAFYLPIKASWKKSETQFCRRKTVEDYNAKIKVSPNIYLVHFCSSKLVHFFKFSFQEIRSFENVSCS